MSHPPLILVTGAPRSGTTVVGGLLAKTPGAGELYEPMNATVGDPFITKQFEVPGSSSFSHESADQFIDRVISRRLRPRKATTNRRHPYFNATNRTMILHRLAFFRKTTVWKDPFAFFLIPQIADRGNIPIVVTVRDPLALAGSFKRMKWTAEVGDLAQRMRSAGLPVDDALYASAMTETDPVRSGSVLWMLYYNTLLRWLDEGVGLLTVETTDLIERPDALASRLAAYTGLPVLPPLHRQRSKSRQRGDNCPTAPISKIVAQRVLRTIGARFWTMMKYPSVRNYANPFGVSWRIVYTDKLIFPLQPERLASSATGLRQSYNLPITLMPAAPTANHSVEN